MKLHLNFFLKKTQENLELVIVHVYYNSSEVNCDTAFNADGMEQQSSGRRPNVDTSLLCIFKAVKRLIFTLTPNVTSPHTFLCRGDGLKSFRKMQSSTNIIHGNSN